MRFVIRGLVLFVLLAIVAIIGVLSFTASLNPQPQIERVITPVTEDQYQAPAGSNEKVFSDTLKEQEQAQIVARENMAQTPTETAISADTNTQADMPESATISAAEDTEAQDTENNEADIILNENITGDNITEDATTNE